MTRGELGAVALEGDAFHVAPAFKVKVVDGTGAGDVFRAGFIYGLLQNVGGARHSSFRKCGRGPQLHEAGRHPSVPALGEVRELLASSA